MHKKIKFGQISYLNVWPFFYLLQQKKFDFELKYVPDHPSTLNRLLFEQKIDLAPASAYEYLKNAQNYVIFPNLSISAYQQVQSVLFCSPVPLTQIRSGQTVLLSQASATSVNLLKVLWYFKWKLPEPKWKYTASEQTKELKFPFLEIGDAALQFYHNPPSNWQVYDLASEWFEFTGLPFVFGLWIINKTSIRPELDLIYQELVRIKNTFNPLSQNLCSLAPTNLSSQVITNYWNLMDYDLKAEHLASLIYFANLLSKLDLLKGVPAVHYFKV